MTSLSPFARDLGVTQGRIRPAHWVPRLGEYVFCLGSDAPGRVDTFGPDDFVSLSQSDLLAADLVFVRPFVGLRPGTLALPPGTEWRFQALIDGTAVVDIALDRERDLSDLYFPASHLAGGSIPIEFVLKVVGPPATRLELELPAVYIDDLAFDTTTVGPVVVNRLPAPGENRVPASSSIQLDLCDTTASGINVAATSIWVNGVLAMVGGAFEPGWDGGGSSVASRDAGRTQRVTIDPTTSFDSDVSVSVHVVSETNDGRGLDVTYAFVIGDTAAPVVVGATSPEESLVHVEFSEPVVQVDAGAAGDALNPANWLVVVVEGPPMAHPYREGAATWVEVVAVRSVSAWVVEVQTDIPLTAGATYRVVANNVEDVSGNPVSVPNNSAVFLAFEDAKEGRNFRLIDRVGPVNVRRDTTGDLHKFLWCLQEPLNLLLRRVDRWVDILDPDIAAEPFLDAMLYELGNPFTFPLAVDDKRRLIRILVAIYKAKGTADGIVDAIRFFLGLEVTITYPCYRGLRLGRARIGSTLILGGSLRDFLSYDVVAPFVLTDEQRARIVEIAEYMQAAPEHLRLVVEPPPPPPVLNHLVLGRSRLGSTWQLH